MPNDSAWTCEYKLIYALIVAGQSAAFTNAACARLFEARDGAEPLQFLAYMDMQGVLETLVRQKARTGNYGKILPAIRTLIERVYMRHELDLQVCSIADLETIPGVGPKTARFFMLWTRPDSRCAALDVHVLRWLRNNGHPDAPKSTPPKGPKYAKWENAFLSECDSLGVSPRELDLAV